MVSWAVSFPGTEEVGRRWLRPGASFSGGICMFDSALDLLVVPLQFLLRFWSFDIFRMFWMVLFWIFILSLISRIVRMKG